MEVYGASGYNGYGQFGDGTETNQSLPKQMQNEDGSILYGVKEVAAGEHFTYIIKEDGTVWSTGYNDYGNLGMGSTGAKNRIQQVFTREEDGVNEDGTVKYKKVPVTDAKHITLGANSAFISRQKDEEGNNQGLYVAGRNNNGALFTEDTKSSSYATLAQTDKDILAMAIVRNVDGNVAAAIADQDGMVYTVGYNVNGEMGNGTVQSLITPWCISKKKINAEKNIINFKNAGEKETINYSSAVEFNLIRKDIPGDKCTFTSMDENVAVVNKDTGEVTAVAQGQTIIKLHNEKNNLWGAVRVNVNGKGNITAPKIVRRK